MAMSGVLAVARTAASKMVPAGRTFAMSTTAAAAPAAPSADDVPHLFRPFELRGVKLRARVGMAPMCQYSVEKRDGVPVAWHHHHLAARAVGGVPLIIAEATAVLPEGRISPQDTGIWNAEQGAAWRAIVSTLKDHGSAPILQLAHAGRKASTAAPWDGDAWVPPAAGGWLPHAPSAVAFRPTDPVPKEMTTADIGRVIEAFAEGAKRAIGAGFSGVELHGAHGYLLHEFLSPLSNKRSDAYGGSRDNRMRLLLEVASAVRAVMPDGAPLITRLSATDWVAGGWDADDSVELSRQLRARGVDAINVSSGGLTPDARIPFAPGFQVPFATKIRREAGLPTLAVGAITTPAEANAILAEDKADMVLLGRPLLRDPQWVLRAAHELRVPPAAAVPWPKQYRYAGLRPGMAW